MSSKNESDTPQTDSLHWKLVADSEGPNWIAGLDYIEMKQHAMKMEHDKRQAELLNIGFHMRIRTLEREARAREETLKIAESTAYGIEGATSE